jgi:hypothetical protein
VVERDQLKARGTDRRLGITSRPAPSERARPEERVDGALHASEENMFGPNVLPEAELTAGREDAPQLGERGGRLGHAAEEPHHDRGVVGSVGSRERLGDALDHLDRDRRAPRSFRSLRPRRRIGLDGQHLGHRRRVVLERAPVAGADVDHAPAQPGQQPAPELDRAGIGPARLPPLEIVGK